MMGLDEGNSVITFTVAKLAVLRYCWVISIKHQLLLTSFSINPLETSCHLKPFCLYWLSPCSGQMVLLVSCPISLALLGRQMTLMIYMICFESFCILVIFMKFSSAAHLTPHNVA